MARQLKALAGIRHLSAIHLQDGYVAIEEIADVEVLSVRAEDCPSGSPRTSTSPTFVTFLPSIFSTTTLPLRL